MKGNYWVIPVIAIVVGLSIGLLLMKWDTLNINIKAPGVEVGIKTEKEQTKVPTSPKRIPSSTKPLPPSSQIEADVKPFSPPQKEVKEEAMITITDPRSGQNVEEMYVVRGKAYSSQLKFYVLVHPHSTNKWWVQSYPICQSDGTWKVGCFFGTEVFGMGDNYDIWAIATEKKLFVGQQIDVNEVLKVIVASNVVTVERTK